MKTIEQQAAEGYGAYLRECDERKARERALPDMVAQILEKLEQLELDVKELKNAR